MKNKEILSIIDEKLVKTLEAINKKQNSCNDFLTKAKADFSKKIENLNKKAEENFKERNDSSSKDKSEVLKVLEDGKKSNIHYFLDISRTMVNCCNAILDDLTKKTKIIDDRATNIKNNVRLLEDTYNRKLDGVNQRLNAIEHQLKEINRNIIDIHSYLRTMPKK